MSEVKITMKADGWDEVEGIPGWHTHHVRVRAGLVDGEPRVIGLRLDLRDEDDDPEVTVGESVLTSNRLRTLPITAIAADVVATRQVDVRNAGMRLAEIQREVAERPRKRRGVTTVEQVAEVYRLALAGGEGAPRATVCGVFAISSRTADRYIAEARRRGLIPGYRGQGGKRTTSEEDDR